jgi:hypothetical protein
MKFGFYSVATAFVLLASISCRKEARTPPSGTSERVVDLYFTTDVRGYIEPCGCQSKPLGGIQRLAHVVGSGPYPSGLVDTGSLLLPRDEITAVTRDQHEMKAQLLAQAYREMGVLALNLGASDLSLGLDLLHRLQREGSVPWISANDRPVAEGGATIARSFLRTVGGIKIGFTGMVSPELLPSADPSLALLEYMPPLQLEVRSLRERGAEFVVILADLPERDTRSLALAMQGADLILHGPGSPIERAPRAPESVGEVVMAEAGRQGQYVGRVRMHLPARASQGRVAFHDAAAKSAQSIELLKRRLSAYQTEVEAWIEDPGKQEVVRQRRDLIKDVESQLSHAEHAPPAPPPVGPYFTIEIIPLTEDTSKNEQVARLLDRYNARLEAANLDKGDPKLCALEAGSASFVGNAQCKTCHAAAYDVWEKTKHAEAWETLVSRDKQFDLTCVGCHVVGYEKPGGVCRLRDIAAFQDVGCENCHGPGSEHVKAPAKNNIVRATTEKTCTETCHVPEHSDLFDYSTYLPRILGPGHASSSQKK